MDVSNQKEKQLNKLPSKLALIESVVEHPINELQYEFLRNVDKKIVTTSNIVGMGLVKSLSEIVCKI